MESQQIQETEIVLPPFLADVDAGVAEALRREAEAEQDPTVCLTLDQFTSGIAALRAK